MLMLTLFPVYNEKGNKTCHNWFQLPAERDRSVYISNLPGTATLQKIEAILEMDADCSVDETCLMKV